MPTISDSVIDQRAAVVPGIYIARGDETLGPYNSLEAAALVAGGYLRADDYAARNGDAAWVPLSDFLPPSPPARAAKLAVAPEFAVTAAGTHPHRWRRLTAAFGVLLAAPVLVAGGMHWLGPRRADESPEIQRVPPAVLASVRPAPVPAAPLPSAANVVPAPTAPTADGPVNGSLSFGLPGELQAPLDGVRVSVYAVAALDQSMAPVVAEAQAARARLDPQIDAAATERTTRAAEAQAALEALRKADPADPLIASLRFASAGAKAAARTAENDYRYLVDERTAAAGGEVYFRALPEAVAATDTDAQGCFTLTLPPGGESAAVGARVRQTADDGTVRWRYWLVRLSPAQRSGQESVRLDAGNASSSASAESLFHTAD